MAMTAAQRAEFDEQVAQQSAAPQMSAAQRAEFDQQMAAPDDFSLDTLFEPTRIGLENTARQKADIRKRVGSANRDASEFTMDVMRLPWTMGQRMKNATKGREEGEGFWDSLGGMMGGYFGETDMDRRGNEGLFKSESKPDLYKEEIGKGEGDWWLDPMKTAAGITTEMGAGAWMGGGKGVKSALDVIPAAAGLGAAGQEIKGDLGEAAGVITGALTGDPAKIAKLVKTVFSSEAWGRGLKRTMGKADLSNASDSQINKALDTYVRQAYPDVPEDEVLGYIDTLMPKVRKELAAGKQGSVGQLTGDKGLLQFEREMISPKTGRREDILTMERINADIADEANAPMQAIEGITEQAADVPAGLVQTRAAQAETAEAGVSQASKPFQGGPTTPQASSALRSTMQAESDASKQIMKDAWAEMPEGAVDAQDIQGSLSTFYDDLGPAGEAIFKKTFGDVTSLINGLEGPISVDDVSDILSIFSAKINSADGVALKPARIQGFKDAIYSALDRGTPGASDARSKAATASRDFFVKFGDDTRIGKALNNKGEEEFASSYLAGGDAGVSRARELEELGGPAAAKNVDEYITADLANKGGSAGTLKDSSVNRYRDQLTPETRAKVDTLRDANTARDDAVAAAKDIEGSTVGKFAQGAGDKEVILDRARKVMNTTGPNRTKELKSLVDSVGTGPARDHLRRSFMDEFVNSVSDADGLTQKGLERFMDRRGVYQKSGLFTKKELDNVQKGLEEGQKLFLHNSKELAAIPPPQRRVLEVVAAIAGAKTGATLFGSPLIGAAIGKKAAKGALSAMTDKQANNLAFELATNPDKFVKEIQRLKGDNLSPKEVESIMQAMLTRIIPSKLPAAVSAERDL